MGTMFLYYGDQDGLEIPDIGAAGVPRIFYAVPGSDQEKIKNTKGLDAKRRMRDQLGVLAYEFDPQASTADRFVMVRRPALDKVPTL